MPTTQPRTRLRAAIATIAGLALAATLVATPAAAASPTACRVKNLDTGVTRASLQKAHAAARAGQRLTVRGICAGPTTIRKSLTITGIRTKSSGTPILDGKLSGSVVTVKRGVKVTMKSLTVRNGATSWAGGGILNEGSLVLRDVVVRANTAAVSGGGVASINGGTLTLNGSSSIKGNSATSGGGVENAGTFVMNGSSSIRANSADDSGGGVSNVWGTLRMNGFSSIKGNSAGSSSGGVTNYSTLVMKDSSSIRGNTALVAGGVTNHGTLVLKDSSSIRQNTAANWIAGVSNMGTLRMRGSASITANVTPGPGGGVYNDGGTLDGVRWPPEANPNVHGNTPDDVTGP